MTTPHTWLALDDVAHWLKLDTDRDENRRDAELCRQAAAAYIEAQRPDLTADDLGKSAAIRQAALLSAARLYARRSSPTGLASFGEFGAEQILRGDPDVARLLGVGRYAAPVVG